MATVFMRWLERRPATYERGIRLLTLGRLGAFYQRIQAEIGAEDRVLEIGCGTGALTRQLAAKAAKIEALDVSADMLDYASRDLQARGLSAHVRFSRMDALTLDSHFAAGSFDIIVSSLAISELSALGQEHVLRLCRALLKPSGSLFILDEHEPEGPGARRISRLIRAPLRLLTWLLTRTTTHPLRKFAQKLASAGFEAECLQQGLAGTLRLFRATPLASFRLKEMPAQVTHVQHRPNLRTRVQDLWALFFRVIPPYPSVEPGLYAIGDPDTASPVLVTGNYDLTVRRVVAPLDRRSDVWLLVVDSAGINVWCGAGGGFLTAERILGAFHMSGLERWHEAKRMILPQLCANGVDGDLIRAQTGWQVHWGPVRAVDIPDYLENNFEKTEAMRTVRFPLSDRLEMVSATLGLYGLMILVPVVIFWGHLFWPALIALLGISYFYALALPWIPGRDGLLKSIPLAFIVLAGMLVYSLVIGSYDPLQLFRRGIGVVALSVFVAAEMQGMSPLMRGEQANWGWEALIALVLGGAYWLLPGLVGWSA